MPLLFRLVETLDNKRGHRLFSCSFSRLFIKKAIAQSWGQTSICQLFFCAETSMVVEVKSDSRMSCEECTRKFLSANKFPTDLDVTNHISTKKTCLYPSLIAFVLKVRYIKTKYLLHRIIRIVGIIRGRVFPIKEIRYLFMFMLCNSAQSIVILYHKF